MRTLRVTLAVVVACLGLLAPAVADSTHYRREAACTVPPASSSVYAGAYELIAQTSRGPLGYYRFGHGSPVVLVTGYRATLTEWNAEFLAELARRHEVVVFDNRGVGRSIPNAAAFTVGDMAHDTAALIETLKLRRPTVVGWSMGGSIVQQLAIDQPHAIGRIVLMGALMPGRSGVPVPPDILAKLSGEPGVTFNDVMALLFPASSLPQAERCFRQAMYRPADYRSSAIPSAVTAGQATLLNAWSTDDAAATALRKLRVPALVLSGDDDAVVAVRNSMALGHALPEARVLTIRDAGHAMMYQYPVALARAIGSFAGH